MREAKLQIENRTSKIEDPPSWRRRVVTAGLVVYWIALFTATHLPKIPKPLELNVSDKWEHYVAYAILGLLLAAWRSVCGAIAWGSALRLWVMAIAYGAFDEVTQPIFGRNADLLDWRADIVGSATGIVLFVAAWWWIAPRRDSRLTD